METLGLKELKAISVSVLLRNRIKRKYMQYHSWGCNLTLMCQKWESIMAICDVRGERIHSGHLCASESQDPVMTHLNQIETSKQKLPIMQHQSKAEDLEARYTVLQV